MISLEKPDPADILAHHGVKGMKWGVRKQKESSDSESPLEKSKLTKEQKKARAKKVAIGTGALLAAAGATFVVYKLKKDGKFPLKSIKKSATAAASAKKIVQPQTDIIHVARGKTKSLSFVKQGGIPNYFTVWENALGQHAHSSSRDLFESQPDGSIAARFLDPHGRSDFSGRKIVHEVLIPKAMTAGINGTKDVVEKIWPIVKDGYEAYTDDPR